LHQFGEGPREKRRKGGQETFVCAADYNQSLIFLAFDKKATPA
jgi:hypothetical protein